ncbi:MAG: hypothetical protein ABFD94_16940 [Armatimonadia bacterium]
MAGIGSFAAGLSQGYMSTYSTLTDIERRKKESERADRLLKMQETEFQQKQDERTALSDASKQTYGRVGKAALTGDLQKDTGIGPQQAQGLNAQGLDANGQVDDFTLYDRQLTADNLRANAQRQGAAVPELPTYTREQAAKDYTDRLYAIDPMKGQQAEAGALALKKGGLEVKELQRSADFNDRFDKVMQGTYQTAATRLQDIQTTAETGGMKGLVDKFGPELKKALGADVQLVGNNIVVKVKGQKPQTISSTAQAVSMLQGAAQLEFGDMLEKRMLSEGLFKSPQELVKFFQDRRESDRKDRDTNSAIALREAQAGEARARAGAQGAYARSLSERPGNWTLVGADSDGKPVSYDRNTGKLAREDGTPIQDASLYRKVTGERPAPTVSPSDVNAFLRDQAGAVVEVDKDTKKPIRLGEKPLEEQRAIAIRTLTGAAAGGQGGGLPDLPEGGLKRQDAAPPSPAQAVPTDPAQATTDPQARVREAYERWQAARGPWYMPTPKANSTAERLEREYEQALRDLYKQR